MADRRTDIVSRGAERAGLHARPQLGAQPYNRDNAFLAFGAHARAAGATAADGQALAGTGALVFEGELLELPGWH